MSADEEKIRDRIVTQLRDAEPPSRADLDACLDSRELSNSIAEKINLQQIQTFAEFKRIRRHAREELPDDYPADAAPRTGYETPMPQYLPLSKDCDVATAQLISRVKRRELGTADEIYLHQNPSVERAVTEALPLNESNWLHDVLEDGRSHIRAYGHLLDCSADSDKYLHAFDGPEFAHLRGEAT
jgi:hypothetical protein